MKKLSLTLLLFLIIQLYAQDFVIETVKEIQAERELAEWIEAMLFPIVGETIVIANLTLDYPASRLQVYGSTLDREKSLPGLPIAKSKSVMPTMIDDQETYPTIVARKEITIYLKKDVTAEILQFIEQNVALWMNINPEKGDVLQIKNIMDFKTGVAEENTEKKVNNFLYLYLGFALLLIIFISVLILRSGFTKISNSMQNINVKDFEKALQIQGNMITAGKETRNADWDLITSKKQPIPIRLVDDKKEIDPYDFSFLEELSIPSFTKLIENLKTSDLALILANLNSKFISKFLNSYLGETNKIIDAMMQGVSKTKKEIIELKKILLLKFNQLIEDNKLKVNSRQVLINVLNQLDVEKTKKYLDQINQMDSGSGTEMRQYVFLYSDIIKLKEYDIEQIVLSTDHDFLVKFLKSADRDVQDKFFSNLTSRASSIIKEDMNFLEPLDLNEQENIKFQMLIKIRNILKYIKE
ncbi:MAG: hypothetical protein K9N07_04830 [Candidatus Cloacimonetes bacterium]|nr:hypothetical protein [Candidatus Cloacimonadota bacterium]